MKRNSSHVFSFIVIAVASCGGGNSPPDQALTGGNLSGAGVLLTTDKSTYRGGDLVGLTIQNQETVALAYNACTRGLEIKEGANWVPGPESLRLCTRNVWYVAGSATRQDSTDLDIGLTPGEYRLVVGFAEDFAPEGQQIRSVSNPFTIVP